MSLEIWTESSGFDFGTYEERTTLNIILPADVETYPNATFKLISGQLPRGTRIVGNKILGTPFEVPRTTRYKFVIRATNGSRFQDRTFFISIDGEDEPMWLTLPGRLPIGANNAFFIVDSSFIDFKLTAVDTDTASGQQLNYFIASGDGELPPGLILLPNGRITGFIQPLLSVAQDRRGDGNYDMNLFDDIAYDFGYRSTNGYDTYVYDLVTYDFSVDTLRPRKLNRNYEFEVTVTDGDSVTKRRFRIFVVGDDFFRADNVIMQAGTGAYTADVTYVRYPIFTTPSYLGIRRASNYQTFKIDIYEGLGELGPVIYELSPVNALIEGICEKEQALDNRAGSNVIRFTRASDKPRVGYKVNFNQDFLGSTNRTYTITQVDTLGGDFYRIVLDQPLDVSIPNKTPIFLGTDSEIPPGMQFDIATGEIFGAIPFRNAVSERYTFTVKAIRFGQGTETNISRRVFTVDIIGEIEAVINWITDNDLGVVNTGYPSTVSVRAVTTLSNPIVLYKLVSGSLPPGLNLNLDGEIVGKVNQITKQNRYRSFWKPATEYKISDIVRKDTPVEVVSITRRQNIASVVTTTAHNLENNEIVRVKTSSLEFNYPQGVVVSVDKFSILNASIQGTGPFFVTLDFDNQLLAPLAPVYTSVVGVAPNRDGFVDAEVSVKSTSGAGQGARFLISKLETSLISDLVYNSGTVSITLLEPGQGYLPGDTVTISGADLPNGGLDGVNDLTFTLVTGTSYMYKINGNSNSTYNGEFYAVSSTRESITLLFDTDPGNFGTGLISVATSVNTFEAQTQLTALNYLSFPNAGRFVPMTTATGTLLGDPDYYIARADHVSDVDFSEDSVWNEYEFKEIDKSLTSIDQATTTLDNADTSIDREYKFTITASDQIGFAAVTRTFKLSVNVPNETNYSNIYAKPFLKTESRNTFKNFINDANIFDAQYIYRASDPSFGIQKELKSLVFAGIETLEVEKYISAMGTNNKPKRFKLGNVKKAVAKEPGTNNIVYEIVYLELIDPLEKNKNHLPFSISTNPKNVNLTLDNTNDFYRLAKQSEDFPVWNRPIPFNASIDRTDIIASDPGTSIKFVSSLSIWRKRLRAIANARRERNYLPLWMRSIQENSIVEIDYIAAIPLCYCKVGGADEILLNIKNSDFDFKTIDYTIDRYIIDSVDGYYEDKYLVFRNDRTTIA